MFLFLFLFQWKKKEGVGFFCLPDDVKNQQKHPGRLGDSPTLCFMQKRKLTVEFRSHHKVPIGTGKMRRKRRESRGWWESFIQILPACPFHSSQSYMLHLSLRLCPSICLPLLQLNWLLQEHLNWSEFSLVQSNLHIHSAFVCLRSSKWIMK